MRALATCDVRRVRAREVRRDVCALAKCDVCDVCALAKCDVCDVCALAKGDV